MTTKINRSLIHLALLGVLGLALVVAYRALNLNDSADGPETTPDSPKPTATEVTQGYPAPDLTQLAALPPTGYPALSAANMTQAAALAQLQVTVHATTSTNFFDSLGTPRVATQQAQETANAPTAFPTGQAYRHEIPGRFGLQIPPGWYASDNQRNVIYVDNYDQTKLTGHDLPPGGLSISVSRNKLKSGQTFEEYVSHYIETSINQPPEVPTASQPEPYTFKSYAGVTFFLITSELRRRVIILKLEDNEYLFFMIMPGDDSPAMKQALEILETITIP